MKCVSSQTLVLIFNISFCFLELPVPALCSTYRNKHVDWLTGCLESTQSGLTDLKASSKRKNNL